MAEDDVVIASAVRTPIGRFRGVLSDTSAPQLGAVAIKAAVYASGVDPASIDEVIMGNVLSAGVGQAPARQAALQAGLPPSLSCTTVNKVCGSGMKAAMLAYDQIKASEADIVVAGGMESMSQAPYLLPKARQGYHLGHGELRDHLFFDGLQNAEDGQLMGCFADANAINDGISREQMDAYALSSLQRAQTAIDNGYFSEEVAPVTVTTREGEKHVVIDEQPGQIKSEKIPHLKPAFGKEGRVTAANASSISDGAAALVVMRRARAVAMGLTPLAVIRGHATYAQQPALFTHSPIGGIEAILKKVDWSINHVDLFEINEAFAMVPIAAMNQLGLDPDKVNIHGGATALGHPIGASGARVMVTLIYALKRLGKKNGVASVCIGGGEATAVAIELE